MGLLYLSPKMKVGDFVFTNMWNLNEINLPHALLSEWISPEVHKCQVPCHNGK
jgi:hypothetical protein